MKNLYSLLIVLLFANYLSAQAPIENKQAFADLKATKKANPTTKPLNDSGSDAYGYTWLDNTESGYSYNWQEISGTGTSLVPGIDDDDEYFGPFSIGFDFPFYDNTYDEFYFSTNGTIFFEDEYIGLSYVPIPASTSYDIHEFVAWHWTDLEMLSSNNAAVYFQNFGDYVIIQFQNYSDYEDEDNLATMQVVFYKNGNIELRYNEIDLGSEYEEYYVVGIQSDPTKGMEIAYENDTFFSNGKSIMIYYPSAPVPVSKFAFIFLFVLIGLFATYRFLR